MPCYCSLRSRAMPSASWARCPAFAASGGSSPLQAHRRLSRWLEEYPRQFGEFRDSDGRTPRNSFFYPMEEYEPEHLEALAALCRAGFGEVEIHLHHNNDTAERLRTRLLAFKEWLTERHGL